MKDQQIKEIVNETLEQLLKGNMLKYNDLIIYERVSAQLKEYYKSATPDERITIALTQLRSHAYYDVLEMYYKDNMTLEQVAEAMYCDISTVVRNKKYLCLKIFELTT